MSERGDSPGEPNEGQPEGDKMDLTDIRGKNTIFGVFKADPAEVDPAQGPEIEDLLHDIRNFDLTDPEIPEHVRKELLKKARDERHRREGH